MVKILGVLGARNSLSKQIMQDEILNPILEDLGEKINSILLPAEPTSSAYIECWAGRQTIPVELLKSCLLYTSPSPRDRQKSRMPSSA